MNSFHTVHKNNKVGIEKSSPYSFFRCDTVYLIDLSWSESQRFEV